MSKKKKGKKISELQKMRIMRDAYKGMMQYWQEQAQELRAALAPQAFVGCLVCDVVKDRADARREAADWLRASKTATKTSLGAIQRLIKKGEWSAAWKAIAKEYRKQTIELNDMVAAKNRQIRHIEHAKDVWAGRFFCLVEGSIPEPDKHDGEREGADSVALGVMLRARGHASVRPGTTVLFDVDALRAEITEAVLRERS
jgi:hypothetical protein